MRGAQRDPSPAMAEREQRKALGAWYTPLPLVRAVVAEVVFPGARSALDPSCGDGRFLEATGLADLTGVDIDTATPFEHDDSLRRDWGDRRFDVVVGNPPFLSQMASATTRGGRSRFGGGPYADAAAEFLALAVRLTRPGGRVGMVLPQSLLSARDAAGIRAHVDGVAAMRWMWWSDSLLFDANVRVWAAVWEVGGVPGEVRRCRGDTFEPLPPAPTPVAGAWAPLRTDHEPVAATGRTLGDIAMFTADFRDQYYGLVGAVGDDVEGPPLVTCGLIDPGVCRWGERPVRFAHHRYAAPRVALERLSPVMQRWAAQRLVPKILVANQTKVIEAVFDVGGEWLPGVPVITCRTDHPDEVMQVLSSERATRWVHQHAAGSGMGAGTVRLNPRLLASIPR